MPAAKPFDRIGAVAAPGKMIVRRSEKLAARSLHPSLTNLYRAPHHSLSEQVAPSRSASNALIG